MNQELPVTGFRGQIVEAVRNNPVTIIVAETGAGKSTQVPQYLLAEDWHVVVTEPRILAARSLADRVAYESHAGLGGTIGYRSSLERKDSRYTKLLFCTDGLALVRELVGSNKRDVLVIDEVHEWNLNIELLVAWAKRELDHGAQFKLVLMSATIEGARLSEFFSGAPVIEVPGRLFPIKEEVAGYNVVEDARRLLGIGRNVLVFQPDKRSIEETLSALAESEVNAELLPLHADLSVEAQRRCFRRFSRPKCVVATNIAQTSVTINDIDAVVDSGQERRIETVNGIEGLYIKPIALADRTQRKGRAGRTRPGIYIDHCKAWARQEFPVPEIQRHRLDQVVLRLAEAGLDADKLRFYHQPDLSSLHTAKRSLIALGCMGEDGSTTMIGQSVAKLPISASYGRMIVEGAQCKAVGSTVTLAAILEVGGITLSGSNTWRISCRGETDSDALAHLTLYKMAKALPESEWERQGISGQAMREVDETQERLLRALEGKLSDLEGAGTKQDLIRVLSAGLIDKLYRRRGRFFENVEGDRERELDRNSVVTRADWVVGIPFDLEVREGKGKRTRRLLRMVTKVDPRWIVTNVPAVSSQVAVHVEKESVEATCESLRSQCFDLWMANLGSSRVPAGLLQGLSDRTTSFRSLKPGPEAELWIQETRELIETVAAFLKNGGQRGQGPRV